MGYNPINQFDISPINHSDIGLINQLNANQLGHHPVGMIPSGYD